MGHSTPCRQIYMSSQLLIMLSGPVVSRVVVLVMRAYEKGECQRWSSRVSSNHRWLAIGVESIWCVLLFLGIAAVLWVHQPHHRHTSDVDTNGQISCPVDGHHGSRRPNHRWVHMTIAGRSLVYVMASGCFRPRRRAATLRPSLSARGAPKISITPISCTAR